jgi:hypothetical protein
VVLIEANNRDTTSNFELLASTDKWAAANIKGDYCIVLNPHIDGDLKITHHDPRESTNAPQETKAAEAQTNSDKDEYVIP